MAGERRYHTRLDASKTMLEIVEAATGMTATDLESYYFIIKFDNERIRLPPPREHAEGLLSDTDEQDIHTLVRNNWAGSAMDTSELEVVMAPFMVYHMIPIIVEMYPKDEVERAESGAKVKPSFVDMYDEIDRKAEEQAGREDVKRVMKDLTDLIHSFETSWGTAQQRTESGRFGPRVVKEEKRPEDIIKSVFGHVIRFAPSGQIRLPSGRLGPRPVNKAGKPFHPSMLSDDEPIRQRKDGHVWMRARARGKRAKTRWIRIS